MKKSTFVSIFEYELSELLGKKIYSVKSRDFSEYIFFLTVPIIHIQKYTFVSFFEYTC